MTVDTGKATKPSLGFWLETESGVACEIAAEMGYGVVILDMEHGRLSRDGAARLIRLAQDRGLTVYSRVAAPEAVSVQDALEAGAYGVIIPQLRDLGHAREVAAFAKYPPLGSRAIGRSGRPSDLTDGEDRRTRCFPMIETAGALEDASRIAALDTVDGLFLGPSDLSISMGRGPYQATEEDARDARRVADAAARAGKEWAAPVASAALFRLAREHGAAFVAVSDDLSALRTGLEQGLAIAR